MARGRRGAPRILSIGDSERGNSDGAGSRRAFLKKLGAVSAIPFLARFGLFNADAQAEASRFFIGDARAAGIAIKPPTIPILLCGDGSERFEATSVSKAEDAASFIRRARFQMYELANIPKGYTSAVFRVAENITGTVAFASVRYELPDATSGLPRSILSLTGRPKGAYPEPVSLQEEALEAAYLPSPGFEVRGDGRSLHFWFGGDVLYTFMHIVYDEDAEAVPIERSPALIQELRPL